MLIKFFNKKNKKKGKDENLYAFNSKELEEVNKQGKEKINKLKDFTARLKIIDNQTPQTNTKEENQEKLEVSIKEEKGPEIKKEPIEITESNSKEVILEEQQSQDNQPVLSDNQTPLEEINTIEDKILEEGVQKITLKKENQQYSYINLSQEDQNQIMNSIKKIDIVKLEEDIKKLEDLKTHNYTISYCDDAYKLINEIRKRYEIVIKYLIGFNNEKHNILNKTTFANNEFEEWKYLNNYIKLLEKIKNITK